VSRIIRHGEPVVFGMFPLHDEEEKDEATGLIGEGPDFVGLVAKLSKEALKKIGGASQRMQDWVEPVEFEGSFDAPLEGVNCLGFYRFPFLDEGFKFE